MKHIPAEKHKLLILGMKKFLIASAKHLQAKLPLCNSIIKHCRCLNPSYRQQAWTVDSVKVLVQKLAKCVNVEEDQLSDEWRLYQLESIPHSFVQDDSSNIRRIDHYWRDIFSLQSSSGVRYPCLMTFVKCITERSLCNS